jgi:hypothetical protein
MHVTKGIRVERRLNFEWEDKKWNKGRRLHTVTVISANGKIDKTINSRVQRTNRVYCKIKNSREEENKNNLKC